MTVEVTRFLPVAGTHGWRGQPTGGWWQAGSPWLAYMAGQGVVPYAPDRPFVWCTSLDGHRAWRRWLGLDTPHHVWHAAGLNLYAYLVPPWHHGDPNGVCAAPEETRIVCHSHGLQPVLYAAAEGLRIHRLISVGSPVRADMLGVAERARPHIAYWLHLHSDHTDRLQWLGTIGDGALGIVRAHPLADDNQRVRRVGHSGILTDADAFGMWRGFGWLEVLRS